MPPADTPTEPVVVRVRINFSGWFVLKGVCILLDDERLVVTGPSPEKDGATASFDWPTSVARGGSHVLTLTMHLDGASDFHGATTAAGYRFDLESTHTFRVQPGDGLSIVANASESLPLGDRTPLERRPIVKWEEGALP